MAVAPGFEIRVQPAREMVYVAPVGELDLATVEQLRGALREVTPVFAHVVIDLRELSFIDSTGLQLLLMVHGDAHRDGWRLSLIQGPAAIRRIFDLTGVNDTLPFESPAALLQERR